jgi:uncharacterized protein with HEPN domain
MKKDDTLLLIHIGECIARIRQYTVSGKEAFLASTFIQDATMRNLQTLAESTQRLSESFKSRHPRINWRGLAGFRNVLVHDYLGINLQRVWQIIERDVPDLQANLQSALKRISTGKSARKIKPSRRGGKSHRLNRKKKGKK